jgi:cell division protein FtsB
MPKFTVRHARNAGYFAFLLVLLYNVGQLLLGSPAGLIHQNSVSEENERLRSANAELKHQLGELRATQKRLLSDSLYLEEIARTRFGMSRKGEKVFYFTPGASSQSW